MKKPVFTSIATLFLALLFCFGAKAQSPALEGVLPSDVQKQLPGIKSDIDFLMKKVLAVNPGFKNRELLPAQFNSAIEELKKQKPALANVKLPATAPSYDELLAAKIKQQGAKSGVVKILTAFKDGLEKVQDNTGVESLMVSLIQSADFKSLAAADKNMFYYAFASAKITASYGAKYNLFASLQATTVHDGFAFMGGDDDYFIPRGMLCHWAFTVAGGAAGAVAGAGVGAGAGAAIGFAAGAKACY